MKYPIITQAANKISNKDINLAENTLNVKFPDFYKDFLLTYNGGIPLANTFYMGNRKKNGNVIEKFYSLSEVVENNLLNLEYYPGINDEKLIIIAATWAAPVICIGVGQGNFGKIYQFEFDSILLTEDFISFINNLQAS